MATHHTQLHTHTFSLPSSSSSSLMDSLHLMDHDFDSSPSYHQICTNDTFLKNKTTIHGMPKNVRVSGIDTEVHIIYSHTQYTRTPIALPEVLHTHKKNSARIVE